MEKRALILFAHGARAESWKAPFERLRDMTQRRMPDVHVSLAFLELMEPRLQPQVTALVATGVTGITVVPVFLGQGAHVLRDLPLMVDELRLVHPGVEIRVAGAVGEDPNVLKAMTDFCVAAVNP
jgi:sirohydrochlorin cobaltochelatase